MWSNRMVLQTKQLMGNLICVNYESRFFQCYFPLALLVRLLFISVATETHMPVLQSSLCEREYSGLASLNLAYIQKKELKGKCILV